MYNHFSPLIQLNADSLYAETGWYENSRAKLFGYFVCLEMLIHLLWYGVAAFLMLPNFTLISRQPSPHLGNGSSYAALMNGGLVEKMGIAALLLMLFAYVASQAFIRLKGKQMLTLQAVFLILYLIYSTFFALYLGDNTFIDGIGFLGSVVLGLLLFNRRLVLVFFGLNVVLFLFTTLNRKFNWLPVDSFYSNDAASSYWFWIISEIYLVLPKVTLTVYVLYRMLVMINRQQNTITRLSQIDALTGVYNRRSVYCLFEYLAKNPAYWHCVSVLYFDLDKFKSINDRFGHEVGDTVLENVATVVGKLLKTTGVFGRVGGEEFVVILLDIDLPQALAWAETLRNGIATTAIALPAHADMDVPNAEHPLHLLTYASPNASPPAYFYPTASFGVVTYAEAQLRKVADVAAASSNQFNPSKQVKKSKQQGRKFPIKADFLPTFTNYLNNSVNRLPTLPCEFQKLLSAADSAMRQAKANGRNCVVAGTILKDEQVALPISTEQITK